MKRLLFALVLLGVACSREPVATRANTPAAPPPDEEARNLLTLSAGAVAVARTGEMTFESSVVHMLDATSATYWSSPPDGASQTLTFALPSRTRLTHIGGLTSIEPFNAPQALDFETSLDGVRWTPLKIIRVKPGHELQKIAASAEARYVRVHTVAPENQTYSVLRSVIAEGQPLEPARPGSLAGCWNLDGMPARFEQRGTRITGVIATQTGPLHLDGGLASNTYLAMWLKAPMWGHAAITVTPDGQHLSILQWHENIVWEHIGHAYLGKRADCTEAAFNEAAVIDGLLARAQRYTAYGLQFDARGALTAGSSDALDALARTLARHPSRAFRIVAREFHSGSAGRRLASVREALRARGADLARIELAEAPAEIGTRTTPTELEKRFAETIELELSKGR